MAKRKNRFKFHGKCKNCGGPITDWRRQLAAGNMSMRKPARRVAGALLVDNIDNPDGLAESYLATNFCPGECRQVADAEYRLEDEQTKLSRVYDSWKNTPGGKHIKFTGTQYGRMSASRPNIAQAPSGYEPGSYGTPRRSIEQDGKRGL